MVLAPLAVLLGMVAAAASAEAAVTIKTQPTATFSGASVTVSNGNFSGLGVTPVFANLTATGIATYACLNPQGHLSPGQNPVQAQPGSSGPINIGDTAHPGRATISSITATVTAPPTPTAQQVGCGGGGSTAWTVQLNKLTATAAQLVITQNETQLFCFNYTLGGPKTGTAC
jgi:hypothetical protein